MLYIAHTCWCSKLLNRLSYRVILANCQNVKIPCEITPPCSGKHCVIPLGTLKRHTSLSANFVEVLLVMVRLTEVQRGQAIALLMQGQRQQQVARHFDVHVSTTERLVRRLKETGRVADRPRSGRPRVTSQRQDRTIRLAHLRNRHLTATETAVNTVGSHNRRIHPKTVRNRLREFGLRASRPNVGKPLNRARRARSIAWVTALAPTRFPMKQWRRVFFTDESRFTLFRADGRHHLYRRRGKRFADACVFERDRYGGRSVKVWGGISHGVKSPLIVVPGNLTAVRYRDEILRPVAVPLVQQHRMVFQHDNARPHVARVC